MQLEVIYTFFDSPQQIQTLPLIEYLLKDKKTLFEFVTTSLITEEKETLCKISCCVYDAAGIECPDWYKQQNGKFYDNDIRPLMKHVWAINCTYEPINK
jgi:hypothetical protein